jgi:quinol monooxygenase YgiN
MTHYYVYYKVAPEHLNRVRAAVQGLFQTIEKECGVRGRWMHRRVVAWTFMEFDEDVRDAAAFEALLEREATMLGVQRHVERFESVSA